MGKACLTLLLLGMACCLAFYAVCANRIAGNDLEFVKRHSALRLFPETWVVRGDLSYYMDLDAPKAVEWFRGAIRRQPLLIGAWFALAKAKVERGEESEAHRIIDLVSPLVSQVSRWKWQEFLLAYDIRDDKHFESCFNFVLARLPHRVEEACYLALRYWGGWNQALLHVEPDGRAAFLSRLMIAKETDAALALWKNSKRSSRPLDKGLRPYLSNFLLANNRMKEAEEVWKSYTGRPVFGIYDGGFERKPLNMAFGWRVLPHQDVILERTLEAPYKGGFCMHFRFLGVSDMDYHHFFQVVPVKGGRTYRLHFVRKCRNLVASQGVFVEVTGFRCSGLMAQSQEVKGSDTWSREELIFTAPLECEAVIVQVRRKKSPAGDDKISGDYWLDDVGLE